MSEVALKESELFDTLCLKNVLSNAWRALITPTGDHERMG